MPRANSLARPERMLFRLEGGGYVTLLTSPLAFRRDGDCCVHRFRSCTGYSRADVHRIRQGWVKLSLFRVMDSLDSH
jgi:hypothetical protein